MAVFKDPADFARLARILVDLADDKRHVQTTTDYGTLSLRVPDYLYDRWTTYESLQPEPARSQS